MQINTAYRASATKGVLHPKIANSERQSLLILKITTSVTFRPGAIVLYIGVLAMAESPFKASMPHVYATNNNSTRVISCFELL